MTDRRPGRAICPAVFRGGVKLLLQSYDYFYNLMITFLNIRLVMPKLSQESVARYPLNRILGSQAHVRVLRKLCLHGAQLSAPQMLWFVDLSKAGLRKALLELEDLKIVERRGAGRAHLYQIDRAHPLAAPLTVLFQAEQNRLSEMTDCIRQAARQQFGDELVAIWIYGSTARGVDIATSDIDIAIVVKADQGLAALEAVQKELREPADRLFYKPSIVMLDEAGILRLDDENDGWWKAVRQDFVKVMGEAPENLLGRLKLHRKTLPARRITQK